MSLYKYLPKKYFEDFFGRGSLKIGTLYEYRNTEQYGSVIGDLDEGVRKTELNLNKGAEIDLGSKTSEAEFVRNVLKAPIQQSSNMKIVCLVDGYNLISEEHSPDLYIYCMTGDYDENVMRQFGCDSCIEIVKPIEFFDEISHRIRHMGKFYGVIPIQYMSKKVPYTNPNLVHPALFKDSIFGYQAEFRAIWTTTKTSPKPLFIDVPRAIRYCRPYAP